MATVHISAVLRDQNGLPASVEIEAATVGELLSALQAEYPDATGWLDDDGQLVDWLTLFLDGHELAHPPEPDTPLAATSDLDLLAHAAGG